jgi:prepilin-type N-terminal cleavage/methylation domain-containing protein
MIEVLPSSQFPVGNRGSRGVTLVELMISIAVLSVIVAIALPAYNNYLREGHFATIRTTVNGMRTSIEDYRLENGNYGTTATLSDAAAITARFGWTPSGNTSSYRYTVAVTATNSYDVWGQFGTAGVWARCDNRYNSCCDSDTTSSASPTACP